MLQISKYPLEEPDSARGSGRSRGGGDGGGWGTERSPPPAPSPTTAAEQAILSKLRVEDEFAINEHLIAEREEDIARTAKDVREVKEMYDDLGYLVAEQGDGVDLILHNTESAEAHARKGVEDLKKAKELQEESSCCIM